MSFLPELIPECSPFQGSNLIQTKIAPPSDKSGNQSPIVAFILLERYNAIKLVQSIHSSLAALSKVIRGTQLVASDVQNLAAALLNQEVFFFYDNVENICDNVQSPFLMIDPLLRKYSFEKVISWEKIYLCYEESL